MTTLRSVTAPIAFVLLAALAGCGDDDSTVTMAQTDLEEQLVTNLVAADMVTGTPVVSCPGDLTMEVGNTMECVGTVEEAPGEETPITVEVLTEDGELDVTVGDGEE